MERDEVRCEAFQFLQCRGWPERSCGNKRGLGRRQREVRKEAQHAGTGTKSRQALELWQEQLKTERTTEARERKEPKKKRHFERKQRLSKIIRAGR